MEDDIDSQPLTQAIVQEMTPEVAAAILGVEVSSSAAEIANAHRIRSRLTHPDRFAGAPQGEIKATEREFVRVQQAYETLRHQKRNLDRGGARTSEGGDSRKPTEQRFAPDPPRPAPQDPPAQTEDAGRASEEFTTTSILIAVGLVTTIIVLILLAIGSPS